MKIVYIKKNFRRAVMEQKGYISPTLEIYQLSAKDVYTDIITASPNTPDGGDNPVEDWA